jgi:hypothetical protein
MASTAKGDAKWATCWRQACYLAKHVYKKPPGPDGFSTAFPAEMAEVERSWEEWDEVDEQDRSGLVMRLYRRTDWDPDDPEAKGCPPCLAFRGTDFEDMRGLAFAASLRVRWGIVWWTFRFCKVFDPTLDPQVRVSRGVRRAPGRRDYTREDLVDLGFQPINILTESGRASAPGATRGTSLNLNLTIVADIMAKEGGDWFNNLRQGLGETSEQYSLARLRARSFVRSKIAPLADKRLQLTGHSLGGGLSSATCCVLEREFPDISMHSVTFNASGVHANTVRPFSTSDATANNFTVADEILTTLQNYPSTMPFVGAVFSHASRSLGMSAMPEAIGTMRRVSGRSPGGALGGKGAALPNLFPIGSQTLQPGGDTPIVLAIDGMLQSSPTLSQFGTRFGRWLNDRYRARAEEMGFWTIKGLYENMLGLLMEELEPEMTLLTDVFLHAAEYHSMEVVIATYEAALEGPGR